ncbi:MAG: hypothetical protein EU543_01100 [Promethearchaeota archaeon]|nr:MAG: hypothetical protein EU543_01100 [Candidatus Lokiarchaeota archaeon]
MRPIGKYVLVGILVVYISAIIIFMSGTLFLLEIYLFLARVFLLFAVISLCCLVSSSLNYSHILLWGNTINPHHAKKLTIFYRGLIKLGIFFALLTSISSLLPYVAAFIHEIHHAVWIEAFQGELIEIYIGKAEGYIGHQLNNPTDLQLAIIAVSGSVGNLLVHTLFLFVLQSFKKIRIEYYVPFFLFIFFIVCKEILYWDLGMDTETTDLYHFLEHTGISSSVVKNIIIVVKVMFLGLFLLLWHIRLRQYFNEFKIKPQKGNNIHSF